MVSTLRLTAVRRGRHRLLVLSALVVIVLLGTGPSSLVVADPGAVSPKGLWTELDDADFDRRAPAVPDDLPLAYRAFELERTKLDQVLVSALESTSTADRPEIWLPMPDGTYRNFAVEESPVVAPELGARYPDVRSYRLHELGGGGSWGRATSTRRGFTATIVGHDGTVSIDPYSSSDPALHIVYHEKDHSTTMDCQAPGDEAPAGSAIPRLDVSGAQLSSRDRVGEFTPENKTTQVTLQKYWLAMATTPDFYDEAGGTPGAVHAVVATFVGQINTYYERDLGLRFVLIPQNDWLYFSSTTAYDGPCGGYGAGQICAIACNNQSVISQTLGSIPYDVGHVLDEIYSGAGCAFQGACGTSYKAMGASGMDPDNLAARLTSHEMGHQFGAGHTYTGSTCYPGPFDPTSAVEPGSGATIMSYGPSGCPGQGISGDPYYFHSQSVDDLETYLSYYPGCGEPMSTNTNAGPPEVDPPLPDLTFPPNTPFVLTASATDPNDALEDLTYTWEEVDRRPTPDTQPHLDNGANDPIFRSFFPTDNPTRIFEDEDRIGEILPTTQRTIRMRLVVRDNNVQVGGVGYDEMTITVQGSPFRVTYPGGGEYIANPVLNVTWMPGGGEAESINIYLSTNGGSSYDHVLATGIDPSQSEATVTLPSLCPSSLRSVIKIEAMAPGGNLYYAVSNRFSIVCPCPNTRSCRWPCEEEETGCDSYDSGFENCWTDDRMHYCLPRSTITVNNCTCENTSQVGGDGGLGDIVPGCRPHESQTWGCPLVPDCPAPTKCSPCDASDNCSYFNLEADRCVQESNALKICEYPKTVHLQRCHCTSDSGETCPLFNSNAVCCNPDDVPGSCEP